MSGLTRRSWGLDARRLARHEEELARDPALLTPEESVARALALGAFWATAVVPVMTYVERLPLWLAGLLLAYAWLQGGVAWHVYRRSRTRRGVPTRLLRPSGP